MTDALNIAAGAVLQQLVDNSWQPISYFSRKFSPAETRYSTFDRELLAVYLAVKHFKHFVEGRKFFILTDHKPLIYSLFCNPHRYSPRLVRHLDYISQFTTDIRHVSDQANPVADTLSCLDIQAILETQPSIDFKAMATAQISDPELKRIRVTSTSLKLAEFPLEGAKTSLVCDISDGKKHPYVPVKCSMHYILLHIQEYVLPNICQLIMFGQVLTLMFANGLVSVYSVKGIKYIVIQLHHYPSSIHLMLDLTTSTLTLSDCCLPQTATPTCSHVSIDSPVG